MKDIKQYNIVVIEDNPDDFMIVQQLLAEYIEKPAIIHFKNFRTVSSEFLLGGFKCDVILLDLHLPDKYGLELITDVLAIVSGCPVIVLTGQTDLDFSIKSISLGITDYLIKDGLTSIMLYKSIIYAIERKKASADLKESEKRYRNIFHLSPQPMCLYDSETYLITTINKAGINHYGYSYEEFLTMTLFDIVPMESREAVMQHVKTQPRILNQTYRGDFRNFKKSGEVINVETYSTPLIINDHPLTLVIAIDVTEKILHEHEITKAIIKAQENERYEIGGELHDNICQILAATLLNLSMIKKTNTGIAHSLMDQTCGYIMLASDEIRNLSHRLAPAFFNDSTLEQAITALFNTFKIDQSYKIELIIDPELEKLSIDLDLQLNLYRIIQEALKNILKYAQAKKIRVGIFVNTQSLVMEIIDDGEGFDVNQHKPGIGLANMKRRAELFSGVFDIKSTKNNGCEITVTIPINVPVAQIA